MLMDASFDDAALYVEGGVGAIERKSKSKTFGLLDPKLCRL